MLPRFSIFISNLIRVFIPASCWVCGRSTASTPCCVLCLPKIEIGCGYCQKCGETLGESACDSYSNICAACNRFAVPFREFRSLWCYRTYIRKLVHIGKYSRNPSFIRFLGESCSLVMKESFSSCDWDFVVPMPTDKQSFIDRSYHHTAELAAPIAKSLDLPLSLTDLTVSRAKAKQVQVSHRLRWKNVRELFRVSGSNLMGKNILLIDDVVTTGATSYAAIIALLDSGVANVDLFSLARSPRWANHRIRYLRELI